MARREFFRFLGASPYVAAVGGIGAFLRLPGASAQELITDAAAALNVFDFEEVAHRKVASGHWAYMASGVDDDATLRANREIFKRVQLRPRRLHDATLVDARVDLFGTVYNSPIFLCPTGGERAFFTRVPNAPGERAQQGDHQHDSDGQDCEVAPVDHDTALVARRLSSCHSRKAV